MDQKMKNFDRSIEQMMNENAVTPPFGMWNRISAELEAEATPVPVSVNSPIPQRAILGFIAGAVLIGASLVTAYFVNDFNKKENTALAFNTPVVQQTPEITPVIAETPVIVFREVVKPVAHSSKPTSIAKPVEEKVVAPIETSATPAENISANTEVSVPTQPLAENKVVSEPYFFPAIDMNTGENKPQDKVATPVTKVKTDSKNTEDDEREVSNDPPRIKFHPKKHRSFSYGRIIIHKKRR